MKLYLVLFYIIISQCGISANTYDQPFETVLKIAKDSSYMNKRIFEYDENGMEITLIDFDRTKDTNIWIGDYKIIKKYDDNNNVISELLHNWDKTNEVWNESHNYIYEYDINNNMILSIRYDMEGGVWDEDSRNEYIYNENNDIVETYYTEQTYMGTIYKTKEVKKFDLLQIADTTYKYNLDEDSIWINEEKTISVFGDNNKVKFSYPYSWEGNKWSNSLKYEYDYDDNGNKIARSFYRLSNDSLSWIGSDKSVTAYDENRTTVMHASVGWDTVSGRWYLPSHETVYDIYYYINSVSVLEDIEKSSSSKNLFVYPNPFNSYFTIDYKVEVPNNLQIIVYDQFGVVVYKKVVTDRIGELIVDSSQFKSGVYHTVLLVDGKVIDRISSVKIE